MYTISSAYVCENAATVVENTSTRRTHFTTCRRASAVEGATRIAIRSEIHFLTRSCASVTPAPHARRGSCVKVTGVTGQRDAPSDLKKEKKTGERAPDSRFESTVGHDESRTLDLNM